MGIFSSGRRAGFTLVELLVIVMILGILSAIALPQYRRSMERARAAEALTMLRALYDSCERYAWENNYNSCGEAMDSSQFDIRKFDILAKGEFVGKTGLRTENFEYILSANNTLQAEAIKGDYAGAVITFDGIGFSCTGGQGEAAEACKVWGATTWNE